VSPELQPLNKSGAFRIAAFDKSGAADYFLAAAIDEVALFDSALTGAQIKQLYRIGAGSLSGQAGNGNITDDGTRRYLYDALNRVVQVKRKSDGLVIAAYTYDAFDRRIRKVISNSGLPGSLSNDTVDYLYDGVQCIEERDPTGGTDDTTRQYVWGQYVDELIQYRDLVSPPSATVYYALSDLLYRVTALTLSNRTVRETYDCDAYGNTQIFNQADTRIYDPKCQFIFTGRRFDPETSNATTQMYFYRARYYSPVLGRFISRDPIDYDGGMNLYEYVGGMATAHGDPSGFGVGSFISWLFDGNQAAKAEERARRQKAVLVKSIKRLQAAALKAYRKGCTEKGNEHWAAAKRLMKQLPKHTADIRNAARDIRNAADRGANEGLGHGMIILEGSYKFWDPEARARKQAIVDRYGYHTVGVISDIGAGSAYVAGGLVLAEAAGASTVGSLSVSEAGTLAGTGLAKGGVALAKGSVALAKGGMALAEETVLYGIVGPIWVSIEYGSPVLTRFMMQYPTASGIMMGVMNFDPAGSHVICEQFGSLKRDVFKALFYD